jgi:hypothetical protein
MTKPSRLLSALALALALLLTAAPAAISPVTSATAQSQTEKKIVKVWVNTNSGVYHCPASRWYGNTKQGKYMSECEAKKAGYRPAYGNPCGSDCPAAATPESKPDANSTPAEDSPPPGATAQCNDGTYSYSQHRSGTCSHHGGVKRWL